MGESIVVTVDVTVSEGCQLLVYDVSLNQTGLDGVLFDPSEIVIGPPVTLPVGIPVTAVASGTTNFHATIYGERYCNDFYNWVTVQGTSEEIIVGSTQPSSVYLPIVDKDS